MTTQLPIISDCSNCGACCRSQGSPPMYAWYIACPADDDDCDDAVRARSLPEPLRHELEEYIKSRNGATFDDDGPCLWLDPETNRCKHYEIRPDICRNFEVGGEDCLNWREEFAIN